MKHFVLIFALFVVLGSNALSQETVDDGLKVTGTVMGVDSKCVNGKPAVALRLYLQFHNEGKRPLVLIRPSVAFSTRVNFLTTNLDGSDISTVAGEVVRYNPYLDNPHGPATKDDYDPIAALVKDPDAWKAPDPLEPGAYFEFPHTVSLRNGFRINGKRIVDQKTCGPTSFAPVSEYDAFHLEYQLSLKRYPSASELLRTLQSRWSSLGHLPLDSNGNITYKSEKIVFENSK